MTAPSDARTTINGGTVGSIISGYSTNINISSTARVSQVVRVSANGVITSAIIDDASVQNAFLNSIRGGDFDGINGLQCVDLTKWFVDTYTTLNWARGNGNVQAANTATLNNLPSPSSTPQAWSIFSVAGGNRGVWGSSGSQYGHTGIVLSVDEINKTATVIHTWNSLYGRNPNSSISTYSYPANGVTFTHLGGYLIQ
jgi:hypothetical protein